MAGLLSGNYLRVRGEYIPMVTILMRFLELPPRARRIPIIVDIFTPFLGTTSACAENTTAKNSTFRTRRNYLRVRGEYPLLCVTLRGRMELPPRARRIQT